MKFIADWRFAATAKTVEQNPANPVVETLM
jgi:hypothetical protein